MKILIYTAVWRRPKITEICFMGIKRLQKVPGFQVKGFVVISEPEMIPLCEKYGIGWCMTTNNPLGAKKNFGVRQALNQDFDYMIEIGSDDLLKSEVLNAYTWGAPVMGLLKLGLIDTFTGACKCYSTKLPKFGAGRAIQRNVLESGDLWADGLNRGMDNNSNMKMARKGFMIQGIPSDEPLVVGLKSDTNIWSYLSLGGAKYPIESALKDLSEEEINAIKCLVTKNKSADLIGG